jgi:hypothetical protein
VTPRHPDTDRLAAIVRAADPDCFTQSGIVAARLLAAGLRLPAEPGAPDRVIAPHADTSCKTHHGPPWPCAASQPVPTPEPPAEPDYNPHPNPFDENGDFLDGEFDEDGNPASVPEAEPLDRWVQHDEYCPAIGAKGECNCGLTDALAAYRASVPAPGLRRWAESLLTHAERDGLVWVTKAEVRAALDATPPPALDVERLATIAAARRFLAAHDAVTAPGPGPTRDDAFAMKNAADVLRDVLALHDENLARLATSTDTPE